MLIKYIINFIKINSNYSTSINKVTILLMIL